MQNLPIFLLVLGLLLGGCSSKSDDGRDADGQMTADGGPTDVNRADDSASGPPPAGGPRLMGSVTDIDFGTVALGTLVTNFVVVTNASGTPSGPLAATLPMAMDFRGRTNCTGRRLTPGETCVVTIEFQPTTVGPKMAMGQVSQTEGSPMPVSYTVRGAGRLPPDAAPDVAPDAPRDGGDAAADVASGDTARDAAVEASPRDAAAAGG